MRFFLSLRLTDKQLLKKAEQLKAVLEEHGSVVFLCAAGPGEGIGDVMRSELYMADKVIAFVTSIPPYGSDSGGHYTTYYELKHAFETNKLITLRMENFGPWPPNSCPDNEGNHLLEFVLARDPWYINADPWDVERVARKILESKVDDGVQRGGIQRAEGVAAGQPPRELTTGSSADALDVLMSDRDGNAKHWHVHRLLARKSPYADADAFQPGDETISYLHDTCKVLVIGAGGLGCEILKDLALSGFSDIHVIDMDNIDITNLNRQFLFRQADVGSPKSTVAAAFINRRCGHLGVKVTAHVGKIQDHDESFYRQFNLIIAGLDNIAARRWMNATLHSMVTKNGGEVDPSTIIPLIDGGTEGFKGQARVIVPTMTSCFDCSLDSFPPQVNFPLCTLAETPRLPEHCIEYALIIMWEKQFKGKKFNADSPSDMKWIYNEALERAETFGIQGVTYQLTMGVVKRIIPAIASTNALISAALVAEALKISTYCGPVLNNYMMYMGQSGVYTHTFVYEKKDDCVVCGGGELTIRRPADSTLENLLTALGSHPSYQLSRPSLSSSQGIIFVQNPKSLREQHEHKLKMTLRELTNLVPSIFKSGEDIYVTDPALPCKLTLRVLLS